jgi:hypothetical protein
MATSNPSFPPDVPKDWDEAREEAGATVRSLRDKASDMADKATETVKDGYERAKESWDETDPVEMAKEGGRAVVEAVERHPLAAFGLGALSVGLIAWAAMRDTSSSRWDRYQPDYGRLRGLFQDYGSQAADVRDRAMKEGSKWFRSHRSDADEYTDRAAEYAARARDYADMGGRMIAKRAEREPIAALLGVGIAVYFIGSMLSSAASAASDEAPRGQPRRRSSRRS